MSLNPQEIRRRPMAEPPPLVFANCCRDLLALHGEAVGLPQQMLQQQFGHVHRLHVHVDPDESSLVNNNGPTCSLQTFTLLPHFMTLPHAVHMPSICAHHTHFAPPASSFPSRHTLSPGPLSGNYSQTRVQPPRTAPCLASLEALGPLEPPLSSQCSPDTLDKSTYGFIRKFFSSPAKYELTKFYCITNHTCQMARCC